MESIKNLNHLQKATIRPNVSLGPNDQAPIVSGTDLQPEESVKLSGTGFAAPVVTGQAAALLSQNPNLTPAQLKEALLSKSDVDPKVAAGTELHGTGLAAPVVSAMAAALLAQNPNLTATEVKDVLLASHDSPNASIAVITQDDTPQVGGVSTFAQVVKNEGARASLLGLLDNEKWQPQLEGSKLQSLRPELEKPGTDVKGLLSKALGELEDGYTTAHMNRAVEKVGMPLAEELGMSGEEKKALGEVAGLYDIGKLAVNESILNFDGKWPEDKAGEWFGQVSNHVHPDIVGPLLEAFDVSDLGRQAVMHHHERPNGWAYCKDSGAPAWTDVPGVAKVIGMADTVDAMQWRKANINRPVEAKLDRATMLKFLSGDAEKGKVDGDLVQTVFGKILPE
jgi:Subtilase family